MSEHGRDPSPRVVSINVGRIREVVWRGRIVRTAIWKEPIGSRAARLHGMRVEGDEQADPAVHGGATKAVYAYAAEDYGYWTDVERIAVYPGLFGENVTVAGLDLRAALVGERWQIGTALLEVTQPRLPCVKLGIRLMDPAFPKRYHAAGRFGAYLRVVREGELRAGDPIHVVQRPEGGLPLRDWDAR